jgi:hypothetical protein
MPDMKKKIPEERNGKAAAVKAHKAEGAGLYGFDRDF